MRLQIKPALRQVWRGPRTVQIGLDPRFATVLDGVDATDRTLVESLTAGLDDAGPGVPGGGGVLALLDEAGVLVHSEAAGPAARGPALDRLAPDAAVWSVAHGARGGDGWGVIASRADRRVEIDSGGRLGLTLAVTLAAAGVGQALVADPRPLAAGDVAPATAMPAPTWATGSAPTQAACAGSAIGRLLGTDPHQSARADGRRADLIVLISTGAADAGGAQRLVADDVPHLSIVVREATIVIGPLVLPGRSPCLRCLDLHRGDRDPAWPRVLAQVLGRPTRLGAQEVASAQLAASLAALQVLAHLDGLHSPAAVGATLEVELPDGLASRREWPVHPACGCTWPPTPRASADPAHSAHPAHPAHVEPSRTAGR